MKIGIAGAGAGKTTAIADTIIQFRSEIEVHKKIFCITFTNNAVKILTSIETVTSITSFSDIISTLLLSWFVQKIFRNLLDCTELPKDSLSFIQYNFCFIA